MRNYSLSKLILIPLLLCISFLAHADKNYSSVYIFGDSLSDTGNLSSVTGGFPPLPYYQNRFSNGPVAVETLVAKLGDTADASLHLIGLNAGHNYAVAGATAYDNEPSDLDTQVLAFQANHGFVAPADALYIILIGGNDIRTALYAPDANIAELIIQTAVSKIQNAINTLSQTGARSFLVINAPDIASIPETTIIATITGNPALVDHAAELSKHYNKTLHKMIDDFEVEGGVKISEFNLFKLFSKILEKSSELGFTNTTDACFSTIAEAFHPDCNYGQNADQFIFFDEIHPTARVHTIFAEAFYEVVEDGEDLEDKDSETD